MYGRFLYYILQFRGVMILTMASLLVVTMVLMILMRDIRWTSRRRLMVITLFFQMPGRYMVYLAANYIQLMFVIAMIVTGSSRSFLLICFRSIFIFLIDNSRILCDIFFLVQGVQVHHIQIDHASLLCGGCMMTDGSPQ